MENVKYQHSLTNEEIITQYKTSIDVGLSEQEVIERQKKYGKNEITQKKGISPFLIFLEQFNQILIYILVASAIITAILGEFIDASVIFGVVIVNAIIGFTQELKARKAIASLGKFVSREATVIRNGKKQKILASEVSIGDIIYLQSGDKVPADIRLLRIRELQIDESALTGESVPVPKKIETLEKDVTLSERSNMAYSSTLVTFGIGTGVAVSIGDGTEIGKINQMISSADVLQTPLTKSIAHFSKVLLYVILGFAVATFVCRNLGFSSASNFVDLINTEVLYYY